MTERRQETVTLSLRLPVDLADEVRTLAMEDDRSVNYLIRLALREYLKSRRSTGRSTGAKRR
jgi:hypothetical protein